MIKKILKELHYWKGYADVLENEKDQYYVEFDKLAKELDVFKETDPGHPETFQVFSKVFKKLKNERDWLAMQLSIFGDKHLYICPEDELDKNQTIMECLSKNKSCKDCWVSAAQRATENK